MISKVKLRL